MVELDHISFVTPGFGSVKRLLRIYWFSYIYTNKTQDVICILNPAWQVKKRCKVKIDLDFCDKPN